MDCWSKETITISAAYFQLSTVKTKNKTRLRNTGPTVLHWFLRTVHTKQKFNKLLATHLPRCTAVCMK